MDETGPPPGTPSRRTASQSRRVILHGIPDDVEVASQAASGDLPPSKVVCFSAVVPPVITLQMVEAFVSSLSGIQVRPLVDDVGQEWAEVSQSRAFCSTAGGAPVSAARILLALDGSNNFIVETLFKVSEQGVINDVNSEIVPLITRLVPSNCMKFCPGIERYVERFPEVRFDSKHVRKWEVPCRRVDDEQCRVWYELPVNASIEKRQQEIVQCKDCRALERQLCRLQERAVSRSADDKERRLSSSSNVPLKYMSPTSKQVRLANARLDRRQAKRDISRLSHCNVLLSDSQSSELQNACSTIDRDYREELDNVISGLDDENARQDLHGVWERDVTSRAVFLRDQAKNTSGSNGNRWSMLTYRMALAVFTRSRSAYEALRSFGILQLPSIRSLQHFTGAYNEKPGWCEESMLSQYQRYQHFCEQKEKNGSLKPESDGILVFDEVKVISKVLWNASSEEISGLCMSDADLAGLHDIFQDVKSTSTARTSYVLQFLWRDLTSNFDVFGPYYTSSKALDGKFMLVCLYDCLRLLQAYGFQTTALVCDGAATNLSMLKSLLSVRGAFGMAKDSTTPHKVPASADHPILPGRKLHFIICPSHQLKNMVNALFASGPGGTKCFVSRDGIPFGWQAIIDLFGRECERQRNGIPRDVPALRKNFIWRDPWTKLNVMPAKIMQQEKVLSELEAYCLSSPPDAANVLATLEYLKACNHFFEQGILSHVRISSTLSQPLVSMREGFTYFVSWLEALLAADPTFTPTKPQQKSFLSWQTWDLLRMLLYGMEALVADFLDRHPGYYIVPVRVTGSAVETLFAQLKHAAGGRLSATNYTTSRAAVLTQRSIHTVHSSGKDYRDAALDFASVPLARKK